MEERDARAEVANRARELVERYGLGEEYRLVQEAHGRHLGSGDPRDLEEGLSGGPQQPPGAAGGTGP